MVSPVHSLGPGERVCLWVQGCSKRCPGCISPELQPIQGQETDERLLADILIRTAKSGQCTGLTISGGDPFEQPEALLRLLEHVRLFFEDILVYTGFSLQEIQNGCCGAAGLACLERLDVLIDGRYIDALNQEDCVLRGSLNQKICFINPKSEAPYWEYMKKGRILETFSHNDTIIVTGIPNRRDEI